MKRFWTTAVAEAGEGGWRIALDGRPVRTPARAMLVVPTAALADAIAGEWQAAPDEVDPRAMPLTGLANAAIDRVAPDSATFAAGLAAYGASDLLCYRADHPAALTARQAAAWDPWLDWAATTHGARLVPTTGIMPRAQAAEALAALAAAVTAFGPFHLAALSPLVTTTGSLILGLAALVGAAEPEALWAAATIDERWQAEQWGEDDEAAAALAAREVDFMQGVRFAGLLG